MADCLAICACNTALARSTLASSSGHLLSLTSGRNAMLKPLMLFGASSKERQDKRKQTTHLGRRGAWSPARAGLGDAPKGEQPPLPQFTSEDWKYGGKLLAGCTAGAALIKYGSIVLPQMTQPNLVIALLVIASPVVASVVVLTAASSTPSDS